MKTKLGNNFSIAVIPSTGGGELDRKTLSNRKPHCEMLFIPLLI